MTKNQLSDPNSYNLNNLIFSEPEERKLPDQKVVYHRIGIKTKYSNNATGDLILLFDRSGSFGISNMYGLTLSIQLFDREGATERQRNSFNVINAIVEKCKDFLLENKKILKKPSLDRSDLKKISPIKINLDDNGNVDETKSPMMNIKLLTSNKKADGDNSTDPKILTTFLSEDEVDENGDAIEINALDYLNKRCYVTVAVKIDSIFVGQMIKLQCKLYEVEIKGADSKPKRLISSFRENNGLAKPTPIMKTITEDPLADEEEEEIEKEDEKLVISDDEEIQIIPVIQAPVQIPVRKGKSKK